MSINGKLLGMGLALSLVSALSMGSTLSLKLRGVETTATVVEHVSECRVEYQLAASDRSTDIPLGCAAATTFQKAMGNDKVILHRDDFVRLRYVEPGGGPREIKAVEAIIGRPGAPVGSSVRIAFDPAHPEAARAPVTLKELGAYVGLLLIGLLVLLLGLGMGPVAMVKALRGRSRGAPKSFTDEKAGLEAEPVRAAAAPVDTPFASPWAKPSAEPAPGRIRA